MIDSSFTLIATSDKGSLYRKLCGDYPYGSSVVQLFVSEDSRRYKSYVTEINPSGTLPCDDDAIEFMKTIECPLGVKEVKLNNLGIISFEAHTGDSDFFLENRKPNELDYYNVIRHLPIAQVYTRKDKNKVLSVFADYRNNLDWESLASKYDAVIKYWS